MQRSFSIGRVSERASKEGGDLVVEMAFASEEPYERWWGVEILDCSKKAVRLERLNDGAPLLFNHNWDDLRGTHVANSVRCDPDKVVRGKVRITSATDVGRDTIALVESDVLVKSSVGYLIHQVIEQTTSKSGEKAERVIDGPAFERVIEEHELQVRDGRRMRGDLQAFRRDLDAVAGVLERADDQPTVYRVTDWEPHENSLVTVPADNTVGVGRMATRPTFPQPAVSTATKGVHMDQTTAAAGQSADTTTQQQQDGQQQQQQQQRGAASGNSGADRAVEMERGRRRGIENLCKANKIEDSVRDYWISTGLSVEAITEDLLKILEERGKNNPQSEAKLGLTGKETQAYSIFKALRAVVDKNWNAAGFELECSRSISQRLGKVPDPHKFYVPFEVQARAMPAKRDLTVASAGGGGYLVATQNMSFIELMRNRSVVYRMGARRLAGLVGSVTIPKQSAAATAYWLSTESTQITESAQTFGQMALSPKNVGAYTEISRQLLLQSSPDAEGIVVDDLSRVVALAIDVGALRGGGSSGEPQGIVGTSGVGSVSGSSLAAAGILEFQSDVAGGNLLTDACGYVTTPAVAALLMARPELPSTGTTRLWQGSMLDGSMFGMRAMSSAQMASATMLYGDWSQVVIGEWGVLEIEVNPYANFQAGIVGVRAIASIDVGLRYPAAFSYASSIT